MPIVPYKCIGSFASNLTWGGMGKYEKYVHDHFQIFTHIRGLKVRKLCKISTIQLANKSYGQKTGRQEEPWEDYTIMTLKYYTKCTCIIYNVPVLLPL